MVASGSWSLRLGENAGSPEADQKDNSHFNFIVNPAVGGTINPTLHYPKTHYSTIPLFHHSICERSEPVHTTLVVVS